MTTDTIHEVVQRFAAEASRLYGQSLCAVILYGSCARGDFSSDSDVDIFVLLDVETEQLFAERRKLSSISDSIDLEYDVVLAPVVQCLSTFERYLPVSVFYQNIEREGIRVA